MKKRKVLTSSLALLVLIPFLAACSKTEVAEESSKSVDVEKLIPQTIVSNLEFSGNIEAEKATQIAAKVPGQVLSIEVNIGDEVKQGDILARLTGEENFAARNSASSAYQNSLLNLSNTDYLMDQKIRTAEEAVLTAQENLSAIKTADSNEDGVSEAQIEKIKLSLESLGIASENLEDSFAQKEIDLRDNALSAIRQAKTLANNSLFTLYSINDQSLPDIENNFSLNKNFITKDQSRDREAEALTKSVKTDYYDFEDYYNENIDNQDLSREALYTARDKAESLLSSVNDALFAMNSVLADTVSHSALSNEAITTYKQSVVTYINQVEGLLLSQDSGNALGIMGIRQAFENLVLERENSRRDLAKQIEIAENQLDLMQTSIVSTKDELASNIKIAEAQLRQSAAALEATKKAKTAELQSVKTQSDIALGNLNLANVNAANTILRAPYDGVVVERLVDEGSVIGAGTPVLQVANIDSYKLVIYVPEQEIINLKIGQEADLRLDSFSDQLLSAKIARISPKSEESSKKVRVELSLDSLPYLKIGMYARLSFRKENERQALLVPEEAVTDVYGDKQVAVVVDGKVELRTLELGAYLDGAYEVIDGLAADEYVILSNGSRFSDGEAVTVAVVK